MDSLLRFLVALIASTTLAVATYIMDDTNSTIAYLPSNVWIAQTGDPNAYDET
jgi:hypothetical protein